ncbi:MAG: nuclear transport factor 2 family protein [Sphingomonadales bacterium]|nr:nuclear transport factor 2 family protein [Sphingomonadales bacterium]MDE2170066.1 nuclear transport factor 2 family protein [Sphingomonadales bacterium]
MMKPVFASMLAAALTVAPAMAAPTAGKAPAPAAKPALAKPAAGKPAPAAPALATPEVLHPIRQFLDGINMNRTDVAFAAFAPGDVTIVDEFAPHLWTGPDAPKAWLAAYAATGQSDGHIQYGRPARAEIEADAAYVIIPTRYTYKDHGAMMMEEGQMTYVLVHEGAAWKIRSWTWSGVKPHAPR